MDIFTRFKTAVKIREVQVDNNVFQLHYRVTAVLLLICAALVASKQHFGNPINCISRDDVPDKIMDTYCWIHSTFTLPNACNKTVGLEIAHPCVEGSNGDTSREDRVYHKYYQWVYFVLFFQAICFYAPHFFWKTFERKLLLKLCENLKDPLFADDEKFTKVNRLAGYFLRHFYQHNKYFHYFIMFEVINLLNVIAQIYIVDQFLGGTFTTYGLDVLNYSQMDDDERFDPMVRVFPRMTKCTFHRFGASGDVQRYDSLCILPLNIINEKIYMIMWFWFVFLALVTSAWLIYRAFVYTKDTLRFEVLRRRAPYANKKELKYILANCDRGDWFVLYMVCKNIDSNWFGYLVNKLAEHVAKSAESKQTNGSKGPRRSSRDRNAAGSQRSGRRSIQGTGGRRRDDGKAILPIASGNESDAGSQSSSDYSDYDATKPGTGRPLRDLASGRDTDGAPK